MLNCRRSTARYRELSDSDPNGRSWQIGEVRDRQLPGSLAWLSELQ